MLSGGSNRLVFIAITKHPGDFLLDDPYKIELLK